jgi:hypothetical protein
MEAKVWEKIKSLLKTKSFSFSFLIPILPQSKKNYIRNTSDPLKRTGFKYASGAKKMTTAGGLEGTFTARVEHIPEYEVLAKGDPRVRDAVPPPEKRGFYTSPGKRALPGTADKVTGSLDTRPVDPYVTAAEVEREVQKERRKKALGGAFKAGHATEQPPPVDTLPLIASPKPAPPKHTKPITTKPFLPSSPRGATEPLAKITYEPIPYDHAQVSARKLREEAKKKNISPRAFVPVSGPKSPPVKPLARKLQPLFRHQPA